MNVGPIYAVITTGIYCRRGCPSRTPLAQNVRSFENAQSAREAGFRPCRRCRPDEQPALDERILHACRLLDSADEPLTLARLAQAVGLSPAHLQRTFTKVIGLSPRRYARLRREERLRRLIHAAPSITAAIYDAGYGSSTTAYDRVPARLGMTPSTLRDRGRGETIHYAIVDSTLGRVLVASTERGICRVDIGERDDELIARLSEAFASARLERTEDALESATSRIVAYLANERPWPLLPIDVRGTAFQTRVWEALRTLTPGNTIQYAELARAIGSKSAARAVARACAANPVALLIPCHRVVPARGGVGGYRWKPERKRALLELERASGSRSRRP
ncbi:MAG TPA: methylated-DNA--[protein]-cysteine S-methyltransferase [Candidatus Baltobacteraceae bacterium]|nr:methylated-DNA--[protein]-cysteine S-methyltransferase [Candidatus Baltobacteraceae bacterium]